MILLYDGKFYERNTISIWDACKGCAFEFEGCGDLVLDCLEPCKDPELIYIFKEVPSCAFGS